MSMNLPPRSINRPVTAFEVSAQFCHSDCFGLSLRNWITFSNYGRILGSSLWKMLWWVENLFFGPIGSIAAEQRKASGRVQPRVKYRARPIGHFDNQAYRRISL